MSDFNQFDIALYPSQGELATSTERYIERHGLPWGLAGLQEVAEILITQPAEDPPAFVDGIEVWEMPDGFDDCGHYVLHCLAATVRQTSEGAAYVSLNPPGFQEVYGPSGLEGRGYHLTGGFTAFYDNPVDYAPRGLVIAAANSQPVAMGWAARQ